VSWSLFRWTWLLEAPLYVGTSPAGSLNRCRLYLTARAFWGAVTADLAQRQAGAFPEYESLGRILQERARFTYFYPAEPDGKSWRVWLPRFETSKGLVWRREDNTANRKDIDERTMRMRLLGTRPSTAIDPSSDTAAEGSLRETECMNTCWRERDGNSGGAVALSGYVFLRQDAPGLDAVQNIAAGGDTRYGLGRLRRIEWTPVSDVFRCVTRLADTEPSVESKFLLAHAQGETVPAGLRGQREALAGWDYGKPGVQRIAGSLWAPGSMVDTVLPWTISPTGLWQAKPPSE